MTNKLYYSNNLAILTEFPDNSIDLVYADPPFNTGKDWGAFDDKWEEGLAGYINFMRPRLEQIERVLKDTGSLYLHCDPTASHYLKVLLDELFGIENFQNEIVWYYYNTGTTAKNSFGRKHDILFYYVKTKNAFFNDKETRTPYSDYENTVKKWESYNKSTPNFKPNPLGPRMHDVWLIPRINSMASELLKYPTQKPIALLERIIKASSNINDIVLDPFCGSGTTLDAAHKLGRHWIGIDEGQQAINTTTMRLADQHGILPNDDYELIGETDGLQLPTVYDATPQQTKLL